ncbi:MAG: DNA recombination protein RmuC [Gammaproteobacteria bacterium]|nr:DNA recombination protein RmuC [Gammaproteobacteria bacterium]MDH5693395.1 DNA recombination protein RmuC [Gammaproteobacteria bacterium]
MELLLWPVIAVSLALISALLVYLWQQKTVSRYKDEITRLNAEKQALEQVQKERAMAMEQARNQLSDSFKAMSADALSKNNQAFLNLARESLQQFHIQAKNDFDQKEKSVENLIKPIKDALEKTEQQIRSIEKDRKESFGALSQHLQSLAETQQHLHGETRKLVQAFRRPEVRGQWGEMTLRRLAELAGMVQHCDFSEQVTSDNKESRSRPDMIVKLPAGREIVVDAKTPLDGYLNAMEAEGDDAKQQSLAQHARHVRERVKELAQKSYWSQFKNSPDFVVLFIPGDQFLSAALDVDRSLLEDALQNRVILATPTSFVALLRAVAFGWRQESLAENAEQIRQLGEELYQRLGVFTEHLGKVGKSLEQGVANYNKAVGSFAGRVMPSARKFSELGIESSKEAKKPEPVEISPRQFELESIE